MITRSMSEALFHLSLRSSHSLVILHSFLLILYTRKKIKSIEVSLLYTLYIRRRRAIAFSSNSFPTLALRIPSSAFKRSSSVRMKVLEGSIFFNILFIILCIILLNMLYSLLLVHIVSFLRSTSLLTPILYITKNMMITCHNKTGNQKVIYLS